MFCRKPFVFKELFFSEGLRKLDKDFLKELEENDLELFYLLNKYRNAENFENQSDFLINLSIFLEKYLIEIFDISEAFRANSIKSLDNQLIFRFKNYYIQKFAIKKMRKNIIHDFERLNDQVLNEVKKRFSTFELNEPVIVELGLLYLEDAEKYKDEIQCLIDWCASILKDKDKIELKKDWVIFHLPSDLDHNSLIEIKSINGVKTAKDEDLRKRDGFKLTDTGMNSKEIANEINNCMFCHKHNGDYCSKGFPLERGSTAYAKNVFNDFLTGCPLNIKISEMLLLKQKGHFIGALAMLMLDNPMCLLTGYRVCNDCMKSCIYQKQTPVHVPQIETKILRDVLKIKWGFEIYDLLTRWNPLKSEEWMMQPYNGKKILIVGAGPAGITMAHYLLNSGYLAVITDGLKIEPLPEQYLNNPIKTLSELEEELDERITWGFGGVAEYGITVRWDKNFLKMAYISLKRKPNFQVFGGVRFGGSITVEEAFAQGFDHIVVAVGAGLPKELNIPGSLAPGMRQANDFLMALHLTNIAKNNSVLDYQVRLPAVVIGGGLTAVDTATEVQAYYIKQIEKLLTLYEELVLNDVPVETKMSKKDFAIIHEMIEHAKQIREERNKARELGQIPNFINLLRRWGGVTIVYRKTMQESPAYRRNHEELKKALEEGIYYFENCSPESAVLDQYGYIAYLKGKNVNTDVQIILKASSVFIATGTRPNIAYEYEHRNTFEKNEFGYISYNYHHNKLSNIVPPEHVKSEIFGPFTSYDRDSRKISYIGDAHPLFQGNVVNAIASATRTYPHIKNLLKESVSNLESLEEAQNFLNKLRHLYSCKVLKVSQLNNRINLEILAPQAAKTFKVGQFYRLQSYDFQLKAMKIDKRYVSKPISIFPSAVDKKTGTLSFNISMDKFIAITVKHLKQMDEIALMGPTGAAMKLPMKENIVIFGDERSLELMNTVGPELKLNRNSVLYLFGADKLGYYSREDLQKLSTELVIFSKNNQCRINDFHLKSDMLEFFAKDKAKSFLESLGLYSLFTNANQIYVIGDSFFVEQMNQLLDQKISKLFINKPASFSTVLGPMQCMLKGICGQCLQWQIDPVSKERTKAVFACSWQCQPSEIIDFDHLIQRNSQNNAIEKIQALWFNFNKINLERGVELVKGGDYL